MRKHFTQKTTLPKMNLQLFAEGTDGGKDGSGEGEGTNSEGEGTEGQDGGSEGSDGGEKTFTQSDVNAMMAKEKRSGKSSILKLFGIADEKAAKTEAEAYKAWKESQKTDEQKQTEAQAELENSKAEAERRAQAAESKLALLEAGVNKDSLDDVLAIAIVKVTEEKDLNAVLADMKKELRYNSFFESSSQDSGAGSAGTGSNVGHRGKGGADKGENIGARLGKCAENKKSSFFKN